VTWSEHAEGVFSRRYKSLDLNVGAVVCDGGVLVIDTRAHHKQARELIVDLREISSLPVRWVINTHHHWDHTFGNGEFFDAAIWGHERCARHLADSGLAMLEQVKELAPDQSEWLDEVAIVPPAHTFSESATTEFGGRTVTMTHLGRGHTDNDIVITVDGVVFAGDLVESGAPPAFGDAFPFEWPDTVGRLLGMVHGPVVPGHGTVVDQGFVATQHQQLEEVARLARERIADGLTVAQATAAGGPFPDRTMHQAFERAWDQIEEAM